MALIALVLAAVAIGLNFVTLFLLGQANKTNVGAEVKSALHQAEVDLGIIKAQTSTPAATTTKVS